METNQLSKDCCLSTFCHDSQLVLLAEDGDYFKSNQKAIGQREKCALPLLYEPLIHLVDAGILPFNQQDQHCGGTGQLVIHAFNCLGSHLPRLLRPLETPQDLA